MAWDSRLVVIAFLIGVFLTLPPPASALRHLGPGDLVSDLAIVDLEGKPLRLSQAVRERGGLVVFWATWNPRSSETLDYLRELHTRYATHDYAVIPVNVVHERSDPGQLASYARAYAGWGLPWPTYFDPGLELFDAVGVITLPTLVYLNKDLQIVGSYPGFPGEAQDALPMLIEKGLGVWQPVVEATKPTEIRYAPENGAGSVFQMGRLMLSRGQRQKATAYFQKAATLDPHYPQPISALSYVAHLSGDTRREEATLEVLREKGTDDVRFQETYGLALLAAGRKDDAKLVLEPFTRMDEPHPKALLGFALICAIESNLPSAERILERLQAWSLGGVTMEIDVSAYVDPSASPDQRWQGPDTLLQYLLELK